MSVTLISSECVTREEYHRWCEAQPHGRYERIDGQIVAMAPERIAHVRTKQAVFMALARSVAEAGLRCEALADGVSVQTENCDYEPDALVNCGDKLDGNAIAASHPMIIVEVLSPSTASTDTGGKLSGYFSVPSVAHYLIVHATRKVIVHHRRAGDRIETCIVASGNIQMDPPGITISMDGIYAHLPEA